MAFQVVFRPRAVSDIENAVAWLARISSTAAGRWRTGLLSQVDSLETDPTRHPMAEESADLGVDLRELTYGVRRNKYRILFVVEGQTVNILRVRHAARDRLAPDDI